MDPACPICGARGGRVFFERRGVPILCNRLYPTLREALAAPLGDLRLALCRRCTHVFNVAFDEDKVRYGPGYENALHFSPLVRRHERALARRLVRDYGLENGEILDIGAGDGAFLGLLCGFGRSRGVGFDPSAGSAIAAAPSNRRVRLVAGAYSARRHRGADLICCRHVLEHLGRPVRLLRSLRRTAERTAAALYFEVPNAAAILRDGLIWDVIYEHFSYFSAHSLARLFAASGFTVRRIEESFGGQFLSLEAGAAAGATGPGSLPPPASDFPARAESFARTFQETRDRWRGRLGELRRSGARVVVWGAGSKGISFLNSVGRGSAVRYAVDLSPRKWGRFVPGTGQRVVAAEFLMRHRPDVVVVMNPLYRREIGVELRRLGVSAAIVCA